VPANETRAVQIIETPTKLTIREQRALDQAEHKIARGLKSFLEVGMALKEIKDKRLYRQEYNTFQEYCDKRWELSRPRAYELCAASQVVADLSAMADIRLLPENERQARPLTWLKEAKHRKRAWEMALNAAKAGGRPVTSSDVEAAVLKLDGKTRSIPVNGVPVFDRSQGISQLGVIRPQSQSLRCVSAFGRTRRRPKIFLAAGRLP
jgi:hypothetical protein